MASITAQGLVIDRQPDITTRVTQSWQAAFGTEFDVTADSDALRLADPIITGLADLHELLAAVVDGTDEARAQGLQLDAIGRLRGTFRDPGAASVGTLRITGDAGTTVPSGYECQSSTTDVVFVTTAAVTLPDTGAPDGTEVADVAIESRDLGAFAALADTITVPISVVGGVVSITNPDAVTPGRAAQTDPEYRNAQRASLVPDGLGTIGGIFDSVSAVENVQAVRVINNNTDVADPDGVPPKHVRVVVFPTLTSDDDKQAVAVALANNQTGVLAWDGSEVFDVTTRGGIDIQVRYQFATPRNIVFSVALTTTTDFPSNGVDLVREQVLKWFGGAPIGPEEDFVRLAPGDDVIVQRILCNVLTTIPGITFITMLADYKPSSPSVSNVLTISANEIAAIEDAANDITITT